MSAAEQLPAETETPRIALVAGEAGKELVDPLALEQAANALIFPTDDEMAIPYRERLMQFEAILLQQPQAEIPVRHEFIPGLYRREITFAPGTLATGKVHTVDHMDVMLTGQMIIATPDGPKLLTAPCTLITRAGDKKAGVALTEVIWTSYHPNPNNETDPAKLEAMIACDGFEAIEVRADHRRLEE